MHEDVRDLRHKIAEGKVLIIAGTGVSIAATSSEGCTKMENPNHPASWTGLLKAGVEYCYNNANYAELRPNLDWMRTGLDARQLPPELGAHDVEVC